ncbi:MULTISPECIES: hypothetical protein [unclassified Neisseria]|uniref:hypothetical protein n=1 Tax=unclassified Neisseria TaxID=2623750 RepID=UPI002666DB26|nr:MULTISPECIES: hypothetical protein [unclassified Neisseria]MDO1508770.1 hypothetical protein [Neisseria sp. MVDL19-042950]MDO1515029.1 hypothetical protein [Neisseria sp. MVDL18-041461]MDO1562389.1 hypothetical protein [Neisseria sp. MVDL20-010259]
MLMQFLSTYQAFSVDMGVNRRILLDVLIRRLQNESAAFNQAAGFDSPNTTWQTSRRYPLSGGVFTSAFPCCTFSYGEQGNGRLYACWKHVVQSVNPFLLFPALTFDSVKRGIKNQREKVHIMRKIRKGYSRPLISRSIRSFDSLADAGRFIDRLTASNSNDYRFNIVQNGTRWTVCNVISGEV